MRLLTALLASTFAIAAGGWVQLLPAGDFAARDGRPSPGKKWKLNDLQGEKLAADFNQVARATPVLIDYDHQTLYLQRHGQKAPAAGWMKTAEWRKGQGLFAKVEWTAAAAEHIDKGEYLYVSPVLTFDKDTFEVRAVTMAALVNYPAVLGMSPALAHLATQFHQEQDTMNPILAALLAGLGLQETATQEQATTALAALTALRDKPAVPAALATALNLQAGADEAAALAAVQALNKPDNAAASAMAAMQAQLAALTAQVTEDKVVTTVDDALKADKLIPAQRDWALGLGRKDAAALSAYLATAPVIPLAGQSGGKGAGDGATQTDALAGDVAKAFGLTAEQFAKGAPAKA